MSPLEAMLVGKGIDEIVASQWAKFLVTVFDTLRSAEAALIEPAAWQVHIGREGALLEPRKAASERNRRLPTEEGLTCGLAEHLWAIRASAPIDHPLRLLDIQFHSEARMPSRKRTGKHARRTDIWARSALSFGAPAIVLEAKLIVTDADLRNKYFGVGGLGCFTEPPEPHTKGSVGALIAYTVEEGCKTWPDRIMSAMARRKGLSVSNLHRSSTERGAPDLWSDAERPNLGIDVPIGIAHFVMRFSAEPAE